MRYFTPRRIALVLVGCIAVAAIGIRPASAAAAGLTVPAKFTVPTAGVGTEAGPYKLFIDNTTGGAIRLLDLTDAGGDYTGHYDPDDFWVEGGTCVAGDDLITLGPGESCSFDVFFSPSGTSTRGLKVRLTSSAGENDMIWQGNGTNSPARQGYWMLRRDGVVNAFGAAKHYGDADVGGAAAVDLEPTATGNGYLVLDELGRVNGFSDWQSYSDPSSPLRPGEKATALSVSDRAGYWIFTDKGRVISRKNAKLYGDMSATRLNGPVLDSNATPTGAGYFMVGSDGGIFSFGDARFRGSMGATHLNQPVQSLVPDLDRDGYWLVASDGGIFAFDSPFYGSMGGTPLNKPITGMVGFGKGYLMVAEDGGIFSFGDAPFFGSLGDSPPPAPVVAATVLNDFNGPCCA